MTLENWIPFGYPTKGYRLKDGMFVIGGVFTFVTAEEQLERMTPERRAQVEAMFCNEGGDPTKYQIGGVPF